MGQEGQVPAESAAQLEAERLLQTVPGALSRMGVRWAYLVAEVEYPQWDDMAADAERRQRDAGGVIRRFLGEEMARSDLHGMPVHEVLRILSTEGWELAAIDHPAPAGGLSRHYYVFKRMALEEGSPR